MRTVWSRKAWAAGLVAVFGASSLGQLLPSLRLDASSEICLSQPTPVAWIGLHLHVLSASSHCAHGSFAPGENFSAAMTFSMVVSFSALVVGLVSLLLAVGGGIHVRKALMQLRDWLRSRLGVFDVTGFWQPPQVPVPVRVSVVRSPSGHRPQQRRGPPSGCC